VVRVPRRVFQRLLLERPTPERDVEGYSLQRTRFDITERKLRRRQLIEDWNVEISGRDFDRVLNGVVPVALERLSLRGVKGLPGRVIDLVASPIAARPSVP
jgi:hypothetical protein